MPRAYGAEFRQDVIAVARKGEQAMDEVHVAQFAGLVRLLSK